MITVEIIPITFDVLSRYRYRFDSPAEVAEYWDKAMVEAERCSCFTYLDKELAGNWAQCAVGACGSAVQFVEARHFNQPRFTTLRPADDVLHQLGLQFATAVRLDRVQAAKLHRQGIIGRIHVLTSRQRHEHGF